MEMRNEGIKEIFDTILIETSIISVMVKLPMTSGATTKILIKKEAKLKWFFF